MYAYTECQFFQKRSEEMEKMKIILEKEAEDFLEKNQFSVVNRNFIKNKYQLKNIKLSFPWVMKVYSKKIIHKNKAARHKSRLNSALKSM